MTRPNASKKSLFWWQSLSAIIFAIALLLYPARFRRIYGAQMTQIFRDTLRAAAQRGGLADMAHVWRVTLGDLLITVLAEHLEEGRTMERRALYRATGMVSMIGVAAWAIGSGGIALLLALTHRMGGPPPLTIAMLMPTAWMFFVVGFVGLYTWLATRCGAVVWRPGLVAIIALLLMMAGTLYWTWASRIGVEYSGSVAVVNVATRSAVNDPLDVYASVASNLGVPVVGLALIATAWLTRKVPELRAVTRTLLVMGIVSAAYYFVTDIGAPSLLSNTGAPGLLVSEAGVIVFAAVWLIGWIALGRWLWRAGAIQSLSATQL